MACSGLTPSSGNSCEGFITQFTVQKHKRGKVLNAHGHDNVLEIGVFSHGDQDRAVGVSQVHANQLNECGDQEYKTIIVSKGYEYESCKL